MLKGIIVLVRATLAVPPDQQKCSVTYQQGCLLLREHLSTTSVLNPDDNI